MTKKTEAKQMVFVAGIALAGRPYHSRIDTGVTGDPLILHREPTNEHDRNAIRVSHHADGSLGFIPRAVSKVLAPMMDMGFEFQAHLVLGETRHDQCTAALYVERPGDSRLQREARS